MNGYVKLTPAAARQFRKLTSEQQTRVRTALSGLVGRTSKGADFRGGKDVKAIKGREDNFLRLRAGDYRIMFDLVDRESTILVLGIVHRREVERWLKSG